MMDADTQRGEEREAGRKTGSWSEILLPSVDQSSNSQLKGVRITLKRKG